MLQAAGTTTVPMWVLESVCTSSSSRVWPIMAFMKIAVSNGHPLPGSPDMSAPFISAYLQIIAQHILDLRVFLCADGYSNGVQNAQVCSFFDNFRYIFQF